MRALLFLFVAILPSAAWAAEEKSSSDWNGFEKLEFKIADHSCVLVRPKEQAAGAPWIWRTEFFGHEPQADIALLKAGWHLATCR